MVFDLLKFFRCKKANGKMLFALLDKDLFPGVERTIFIDHLSTKATNSIESKVYDLKFFLDMMSHMHINIERAVQKKEYPAAAFIRLYIEASKFENRQAKDFICSRAGREQRVTALTYTNKQILDIQHKRSVFKPVSTTTRNRRLDIAREYLNFLNNLHEKTQNITNYREFENIIQSLKIARSRRSAIRDSMLSLDKAINKDTYIKLLEIIEPRHSENPFKSCKWRNQLIISIILWGGIRRSSCAKLKISDFDFTGDCNLVKITRTPDDISDPRRRVPAQKTRAHRMVLPSELMLEIKNYYEISRKRYLYSREHEFIFITEKKGKYPAGFPLSANSINKVFERLSDALGQHIHPHLLRHQWHSPFEAMCKELGLSNDEREKIRIEAMGWAIDSKMHLIYNQRHYVSKMQEAIIKHSKRIMHG
ncbi:hypothetical protein CA161_11775 [Vibrio parahaemolyticus]|nr:hypothetical protein CA161_11775 [Vibrio parahaemolyticus]